MKAASKRLIVRLKEEDHLKAVRFEMTGKILGFSLNPSFLGKNFLSSFTGEESLPENIQWERMYPDSSGPEIELNPIGEYNPDEVTVSWLKGYKSWNEWLSRKHFYPGSDTAKRLQRTYKINCKSEDDASAIYSLLLKKQAVEYVQYDQLNELYTGEDELSDEQWALTRIDCREAWEITKGKGITVAVIDSGVDYTHEDLAANMWDDGNGKCGWDFALKNCKPMDSIGHGTLIAGIIAALEGNTAGIAGVAPLARIMAVKIYPEPWDSICGSAIRYAVDKGAKVLNISWGSVGERGDNKALDDAIDYAYERDVVMVFAAGNASKDVSLFIPASNEKGICVGSSNRKDERAATSNYGAGIAVAAPGDGILSLQLAGGYEPDSGTSVAAPHVAGLAALLLSLKPDMKPDAVKKLIQKYTDPINPSLVARPFPKGRINILACVKALKEQVIEDISGLIAVNDGI